MRAASGDVTRQAQASEVIVDHAACAGMRGGGRDVLGSQPGLLRPFAAQGGMLVAHQADHLVGKQLAQMQIIGRLRPVADHDIAVALR